MSLGGDTYLFDFIYFNTIERKASLCGNSFPFSLSVSKDKEQLRNALGN